MRIFFILILTFWITLTTYGQLSKKVKLAIPQGKLVVLRDTSFITRHDTILYLPKREFKEVRIKEDPYLLSKVFYDSLRTKAARKKISKGLIDLLVKRSAKKVKINNSIERSEDTFKPYEGYTIGIISFKGVDILEGSVLDTLQKASTKLGKAINKIHRDTRAFIIEANLFFESGDKVDPYQLADNERVLRQFRTLRDARILLRVSGSREKTVDVVIVTQDVASFGVGASYSTLRKFRLDVYDINLLGYAKQLQLSYFKNKSENPVHGYSAIFRAPNIRGSFIQAEAQYTNNYLRTQTRVSLARDFITPEIKYAGGLELFTTNEKFYFEDSDTLEIPYHEKRVDGWLGRSFKLAKRVNLITSFRTFSQNFYQRPFVSPDSNSFFYNRTLFLSSITATKRNYLKSSLIRGFGRTEDVPVGYAMTLLLGSEVNEFVDRTYYGIQAIAGKYIPAYGYFSGEVAYSIFTKLTTTEDGIFSLKAGYFSDLFKIRRVRSRQFINISYTKGLNRKLDRTLGVEGHWLDKSSLSPFGSERFVLAVENVYFMPWYRYGFRFALYHKFTLNLLTANNSIFERKSVFPSIGVGIRMLNENLVFPTFSIDFSYYMKSNLYQPDFQIKFTTQLKPLFGIDQKFKPTVAGFY